MNSKNILIKVNQLYKIFGDGDKNALDLVKNGIGKDELLEKSNCVLGLNNINLNIHPFIAAYLEKGYPSVRLKWYFKHKTWIKIVPRDAYKYLEYRFLDENGKSI